MSRDVIHQIAHAKDVLLGISAACAILFIAALLAIFYLSYRHYQWRKKVKSLYSGNNPPQDDSTIPGQTDRNDMQMYRVQRSPKNTKFGSSPVGGVSSKTSPVTTPTGVTIHDSETPQLRNRHSLTDRSGQNSTVTSVSNLSQSSKHNQADVVVHAEPQSVSQASASSSVIPMTYTFNISRSSGASLMNTTQRPNSEANLSSRGPPSDRNGPEVSHGINGAATSSPVNLNLTEVSVVLKDASAEGARLRSIGPQEHSETNTDPPISQGHHTIAEQPESTPLLTDEGDSSQSESESD